MADRRFKAAQIYVNDRKIALAETTDFTHATNDEDVIVSEGWVGATDGADTYMSTVRVAESQANENLDLANLIRNKQYCDILYQHAGAFEKVRGRFMERKGSSDAKSGKQTTEYSFRGGKPQAL